MRRILLVILWCLAAVQALALSDPEVSKEDAHVRTVAYDPQNRTPLVLQKGMVTNITFDKMEMIKRIVFGDANGPVSSLDKTDANQDPLINNLPLFGKEVGSTDLIVITRSPDGQERAYLFALQVVPPPGGGGEDPHATFGLSFTYPIQEKEAQQQQARMAWQERRKAKALEVAEARLDTDVFYGPQHWSYMAVGHDRDIAPTEAHDNTRLTALRYPGNMGHPAVFKVNDDVQGKPSVCQGQKPTKAELQAPEQALDTTVVDDMIVVQQTAPHFRLRSGDEVLDLYNCDYDPIGSNPGTGTTSPDVIRHVIGPAPPPKDAERR
jgi:type IV secretion system protein VirB9